MLLCIDENLARSERRIFRNFCFGEFLDFERQNIWHFNSFAGLKMFPVFARIQFLNVGFSGMKPLCDEFQQRCVGQPFQLRLLGAASRNVADLFQVFLFDRVSCVSHRHLIEHPLIDRAGLRHRVRVLI